MAVAQHAPYRLVTHPELGSQFTQRAVASLRPKTLYLINR